MSVMKSTALAGSIVAVLMALAYSVFVFYQDTYSPEEPLNPLSAVPLDEQYLSAYSDCSNSVLKPQIKAGLKPTRSDLYYTEWRCRIAEKSSAA